MPTRRLWCPLCSGSHQKMSCGYPCADISQGHQLRQANDSSSRGLLWSGMMLQSNVDNTSTRDLTRASAAGGWPDCPRAVPAGMYPAAEADRQMSVTESHLTLASRRNKISVAQLVPVAVLLLNLLPLELSCLQSEQELSETCEVWQDASQDGARSPTFLHRPQTQPAAQEPLRGALGQGKARHRQDHVSRDPRADGTPAALSGMFYPLGNRSLRLCSTKSCKTIIWPLSSPLLVFF